MDNTSHFYYDLCSFFIQPARCFFFSSDMHNWICAAHCKNDSLTRVHYAVLPHGGVIGPAIVPVISREVWAAPAIPARRGANTHPLFPPSCSPLLHIELKVLHLLHVHWPNVDGFLCIEGDRGLMCRITSCFYTTSLFGGLKGWWCWQRWRYVYTEAWNSDAHTSTATSSSWLYRNHFKLLIITTGELFITHTEYRIGLISTDVWNYADAYTFLLHFLTF